MYFGSAGHWFTEREVHTNDTILTLHFECLYLEDCGEYNSILQKMTCL